MVMGLLDSILRGRGARSGGGMSPITMALLGLLAYRTFQGKGPLADMLGRGAGGAPGANPHGGNAGRSPSAGGGLGGLLGGLLGGGAAGSLISGGIGDLLKQFQQNGQGEKAQSWINRGPNEPVSPGELERALGADRIDWLTQQTGMSREQLLEGLSRELPEAVDKLTPDGRIPTEAEAARMV
jgi:uncharacterized protein YidB (DUF937 family)